MVALAYHLFSHAFGNCGFARLGSILKSGHNISLAYRTLLQTVWAVGTVIHSSSSVFTRPSAHTTLTLLNISVIHTCSNFNASGNTMFCLFLRLPLRRLESWSRQGARCKVQLYLRAGSGLINPCGTLTLPSANFMTWYHFLRVQILWPVLWPWWATH